MKDARAIFLWTLTAVVLVVGALILRACAEDAYDPPPHFLHFDR